MSTPKPRVVLFDLDGTLIDSAVAITAALNQFLQQRSKPSLDVAGIRKWVSLGAADLVRNALGESDTNLADDIAEFRSIYRAMTPDPADLFPHTLEMLVTLKERGHTLGVCTNKPEELARHVIKGTGMEPFMQTIVGGRDGLPSKPDPAPIFETLKQMGSSVDESIYIGDSEVDAEATKAAGVPLVLVSFGYALGKLEDIACAARIDDFRQLPDLLSGRIYR